MDAMFYPQNQYSAIKTGAQTVLEIEAAPGAGNYIVIDRIHLETLIVEANMVVKFGEGAAGFTFTGEGLDDLTVQGQYTGTTQLDYKIEIDLEDTPDTFRWSDDGGSTWDVEDVAVTGSAQTLNNGITITFAATTGHTLTEYWEFTVGNNFPPECALDVTTNIYEQNYGPRGFRLADDAALNWTKTGATAKASFRVQYHVVYSGPIVV